MRLHVLVGNRTRVVATNHALIACLEHGYEVTRIADIGVWLGELRSSYVVATD